MKPSWTLSLGRRLSVLALSSAILLASAACSTGGGEGSSGVSSGPSSAKGRYVEEELSLPHPNDTVLSLTKLDGGLRLLTYSGIFDSQDGGRTWTPAETGSKTLNALLKEGTGLSSAAWGPDGTMVFAQRYNGENYRYWIVGKDGAEKELVLDLPENEMFAGMAVSAGEEGKPEAETGKSVSLETEGGETPDEPDGSLPQNRIQKFQFLPGGSLLGLDQNGTLYHIDPDTGAFLHTFKAGKGEFYTDFAVAQSTLAAQSFSGVDLYRLSDWGRLDGDSALNEFFSGTGDMASDSGSTETITTYQSFSGLVGSGDVKMFADSSEDCLYFCSENGVYRHIVGGSSVEQIINGSLTSLADPFFHVQEMVKTGEGAFQAICWKETSGTTSMVSYEYDPDMAAMPEKELKAYALQDSIELRQAIAMYQKAHPDVYVNLELPLTGGSAMTLSDALRALNTNIMAGKGPDVLFLDGMPVENYLEKGLLADISGLVQEAAASDGLYENIVGAYRKDGKDYAVPTRFLAPIQDAPEQELRAMQDLASAADTVERLRKEQPAQKSIVGADSARSLLDRLFDVCSPAWVQKDGALDRDALSEFLRQSKRIWEADRVHQGGDVPSETVSFGFSASSGGSICATELITGDQLISLQFMSSINALASLVSVNDKLDGYAYAPQAGQAKNVFVPTGVVGVSAKSSLPEEARAFVKYLLSQEAQTVDQGLGIPVNKAAFDEVFQKSRTEKGGMAIMSADGAATVELTFRAPTDEEYDFLKELISSLNTPSVQDTAIRNAVMEAAEDYLEGNSALDAALDAILKKVDLYLSE